MNRHRYFDDGSTAGFVAAGVLALAATVFMLAVRGLRRSHTYYQHHFEEVQQYRKMMGER